MSESIHLAVYGAAGRMGQAVVRAAVAAPQISLAAALVRPGSSHLGQPLTGPQSTPVAALTFADAAPGKIDVLIDFSNPAGFDAALALARARGCAFVSGTTGLSDAQRASLAAAAAEIPVLWASNFSLGVALLTRLAREAARALPDWDCEIAEAHHHHKVDAPSGTALSLGAAIADARGSDPAAASAQADRSGARVDGTIGYSVVRGGDIVGEHSVLLIGTGERIELVHRAQSREIFAAGAVRAAAWLAGRNAGNYSIDDVLGLTA